jgi:membrane protein DedA with SNARE-associated domain
VSDFLDSAIRFWSVQPLWWTFGIFMVAAITEMWFPPFPGDAFFFVGLASASAGDFSTANVIAGTCIGGCIGFASLYWLGRAKGRNLFNRRKSGILSPPTLARVERWFARWGGWVIVFGRFLSGVRSAVPLVAGIGLYPTARALGLGAVSVLVWNGLLAIAALLLGANLDRISGIWNTYNLLFWVAAICFILFWTIRFFRRRRTRA